MIPSPRHNDELQLSAYCDGELDSVTASEFEQRLGHDELLKARYARLASLQQAVRALPRAGVPRGLEARILASLDAERPSNVVALRRRSWSFQAIAASAIFGAVVAGSVMMTVDRFARQETLASEVVAGHIRGLLAPQPFDIASSDRHTVKPWFTTRLPESPQVPDLTARGFVLLGGRVDVVGKSPVPTIVYRHQAHTVSLTALRPDQSISDQSIAGYNVRSWSDANFTYVAVCDLPMADLATFESAFVAAEPASEFN
jgi:anti-sigma factor RsiW